MLERRHLLLGLPALALARPARATGWSSVADAAARFDQFHAIVIAKDGQTVLEARSRGPGLDRPANVKSVSKTIVAALLGSAIDRGEIATLDTPIGQLAPGLVPRGADPRAGAITVGQLVTMQAGLERTSGANYGAWVSSPNWVANALSRPFVAEPGRRMLYSTGSFHILGAVLTEISGRSLLSLARERLGQPLGITFPPWVRDPQGYYLGGNDMAMSPRAMLRFGEMYRLGGQEVLSGAWVRDSFRPRTRSPFSGLDYGLGWFLGQAEGHQIALARGYGGQVIGVVPGLGLTFAITSDPTRPARSHGYFGDLLGLISGQILPAAMA